MEIRDDDYTEKECWELTLKKGENWMWNGQAECKDGCFVEPDSSCVHGFQSPLLRTIM